VRKLSLSFTRKVGEHGLLYGSVTSMDIAEALREQGYEIDRRRIMLREPIKETGDFTVSVKLHREVVVEVPVTVAGEGGETTTPREAVAATGDEASASAEGGAAEAAATGDGE
jgi:large subunit ribosomal protein L9